ncbi:MAG: hypothetical protein ACLP3B_00145, partial [Syntrophobacteraceae bacterium]
MDRKTEYLVRELWILAWNASVQHAALYKDGAWEKQRDHIDKFKNTIIEYVKAKLVPQYRVTVREQQHCRNIRNLIDYANTIDSGILGENRYKYGVAQKVLNLALKYYWCLGQIEEPPHCPIDKIIIDKTSYRGKINWTRMLTESEYLKVISDIRSLAELEKCSIAQWELNNYKRREQTEDHKPGERKDSRRKHKDKAERTEQTDAQHHITGSFQGSVAKERYMIYLPHGGGGKFDACELVKHIRASGRDYIIQGQQTASLVKHTKPHSLDYWLRQFAKCHDTKQAVNSVCEDLVATGLFKVSDDLF